MTSSTSNSDPFSRAPPQSLTMWWIAAFVFIAALATSELVWRSWGWLPTTNEGNRLWLLHRELAASTSGSVVILGDSRAQLGFSHKVLRDAFPGRTIANLSKSATCPLMTLEELADDPRVRAPSIVLVGWTMDCLTAERYDDQEELLDRARSLGSWEPLINSWLSAFVGEHLVSRHPGIGLRRAVYASFVPALRRGEWPNQANREREIFGHFDEIDIVRHRRKLLSQRAERRPKMNDEELEIGLQHLVRAVEALKSRGVPVVLIRFPVDDEHYNLDERDFPREKYWDRFAPRTGAVSVHFRDHQTLRGLRLLDSNHADAKERDQLTAELVDLIKPQLPDEASR